MIYTLENISIFYIFYIKHVKKLYYYACVLKSINYVRTRFTMYARVLQYTHSQCMNNIHIYIFHFTNSIIILSIHYTKY